MACFMRTLNFHFRCLCVIVKSFSITRIDLGDLAIESAKVAHLKESTSVNINFVNSYFFKTAVFFSLAAFWISCQNNPLTGVDMESNKWFDTHRHSDTSSDEATTDSMYWQLDTSDGVGGANQECYSALNGIKSTVWCDSPSLVAQHCDDFASLCCCRNSCTPKMCVSNEETVPCNYLDLVSPVGFCEFSEDTQPVKYTCNGQCVPHSQCAIEDTNGVCLDTTGDVEGLCLYYELEQQVETRCQLKCTMAACDDAHMCAPIYSMDGTFSNQGACLPLK